MVSKHPFLLNCLILLTVTINQSVSFFFFLQASPRDEVWKTEEDYLMTWWWYHIIFFNISIQKYKFCNLHHNSQYLKCASSFIFTAVPNIRGPQLTIHSRTTNMWRTNVQTAYPLSRQLHAHHECPEQLHWHNSIYMLLYWPDSKILTKECILFAAI